MGFGETLQSTFDFIFDNVERALPVVQVLANARSQAPLMQATQVSPQGGGGFGSFPLSLPQSTGGEFAMGPNSLIPFNNQIGLGAAGNIDATNVPLFRPSAGGARPMSLVMVRNPVSGKPTFFRNAGQPVLFSGDLSAARRVRRVASRAKRGRR